MCWCGNSGVALGDRLVPFLRLESVKYPLAHNFLTTCVIWGVWNGAPQRYNHTTVVLLTTIREAPSPSELFGGASRYGLVADSAWSVSVEYTPANHDS